MPSQSRVEALSAAKAAVRAYSRDPSGSNAASVEQAWKALRTLDAVSAWRRERQREAEPRAPGSERGQVVVPAEIAG